MYFNKKLGFTLAEVLITLGIIGVVTVLTVPVINAKIQAKKLRTAFDKHYSILQQATLKLHTDIGNIDPNSSDFTSPNRFNVQLAKYYEHIDSIISYSTSRFQLYKRFHDNKLTVGQEYLDDGEIRFKDGTLFLIEQGGQSKYTNFLVSIDINGYKNAPNRWGYDLFTFVITKEGNVLPMGAEKTYFAKTRQQYCDKNSTDKYNGLTCAYYANTDADYFKKLF